jgi:hypothetical protein
MHQQRFPKKGYSITVSLSSPMKKCTPLLLLSLLFVPNFSHAELAVMKSEFIYDLGWDPSIHAKTVGR